MKNNLLKLSAILLLLVTLVILAASCGETVTTTPEPVDTTPAVTTTAAITTEKYVEVFDETVTGTNYTSSIRAARSDLFFYNKLYAEYMTLHDYFGRGGNDVMRRLRNI